MGTLGLPLPSQGQERGSRLREALNNPTCDVLATGGRGIIGYMCVMMCTPWVVWCVLYQVVHRVCMLYPVSQVEHRVVYCILWYVVSCITGCTPCVVCCILWYVVHRVVCCILCHGL